MSYNGPCKSYLSAITVTIGSLPLHHDGAFVAVQTLAAAVTCHYTASLTAVTSYVYLVLFSDFGFGVLDFGGDDLNLGFFTSDSVVWLASFVALRHCGVDLLFGWRFFVVNSLYFVVLVTRSSMSISSLMPCIWQSVGFWICDFGYLASGGQVLIGRF